MGGGLGTRYGIYGSYDSYGYSGTFYGVYCLGNGGFTGIWTNVSDKKFKENISPVREPLTKC